MDTSKEFTSSNSSLINFLPEKVQIEFYPDSNSIKQIILPENLSDLLEDSTYTTKHTQKISQALGQTYPQLQEDQKTELAVAYSAKIQASLFTIKFMLQASDYVNSFENNLDINNAVATMSFNNFLPRYAAKRLMKIHPAFQGINQADIDKAYSVKDDDGDKVIQIHDVKALQSDTTNENIIDDMSRELVNWKPQDIINLLQDADKQQVFIANYPHLFITHLSKTSQ